MYSSQTLTFLCSTEKLKAWVLSRVSPTAEATGHSHILNPAHWLQNVLETTLKDSNLCAFGSLNTLN